MRLKFVSGWVALSLCVWYIFFSATYFVEYQFPVAVLNKKITQHHLHEVMRVASKKMKDGGM